MTRYRRALIAALIAVSVAGCSSSPKTPPAAPGGHAAAEYATCLQNHGLTMEQYTAEDGSTQSRPDKNRNDIAKIDQATEACKAVLPAATDAATKAPSAADIEARRRYAACIRAKGVPAFPDPDPQTGDFVMNGDLGRRIKENPATAGAMEACQDQLPTTSGGGVIGG